MVRVYHPAAELIWCYNANVIKRNVVPYLAAEIESLLRNTRAGSLLPPQPNMVTGTRSIASLIPILHAQRYPKLYTTRPSHRSRAAPAG